MRLPLSVSDPKLGDSYDTAKAKFLTLDQRLLKQRQIKKDYSDFLEEYAQLGHTIPLHEQKWKNNPRISTCPIMEY